MLAPASVSAGELSDWAETRAEDSCRGYRTFIDQWPESKLRQLAERHSRNTCVPAVTEPAPTRVQSEGPEETEDPSATHASAPVIRNRLPFEPEMVDLPGGVFRIGSPESELDRDRDEGPRRDVRIAPFAMGRTEVTFAQFDAFCDATGRGRPDDEGWGRGSRPVINISLHDALDYVAWLGRQTGLAYRLPTEAEWEYAARGGSSWSRFWGDDPSSACEYANVFDLSSAAELPSLRERWPPHDCDDGYARTAPVGKFRPNAFGLHDMLGNVWEWTCSGYEPRYAQRMMRCADTANDAHRVLRGGAWGEAIRFPRVANRLDFPPAARYDIVGFRVAMTR